MDERSIIRGAEWRNARHEGSKGPLGEQKTERDARGGGINGGPTGLVTAYKPTLRTITVTNHIVFVATTYCKYVIASLPTLDHLLILYLTSVRVFHSPPARFETIGLHDEEVQNLC